MSDVLDQLHRRLDELGQAPVAVHPDVLDGIHRALVSELDALAGAGRAAPPTSR